MEAEAERRAEGREVNAFLFTPCSHRDLKEAQGRKEEEKEEEEEEEGRAEERERAERGGRREEEDRVALRREEDVEENKGRVGDEEE